MKELDPRRRSILRLLWREGRLSRSELHEKLWVNPNAVGTEVSQLLELGVICECMREAAGPGRPRIPLEIDPNRRFVVGVSLNERRVEACRLNLRGEPIGTLQYSEVDRSQEAPVAAAALLKKLANDRMLSVGVSAVGLIDAAAGTLRSTLPGRPPVSVQPLIDIAADRAFYLENDVHALSARWLLSHQAEATEDVLLVVIRDGQMGASMLIGGKPNRGCAGGGNEIGHTRFLVDTETCYCGHTGCLERICSTDFLHRNGSTDGTFLQQAAAYAGPDGAPNPALTLQMQYLATGLSNMVNFIRPHRLVLVSALVRHPLFNTALQAAIRARLLDELVRQVRIDLWDQPVDYPSESAAWLALAGIYYDGWSQPN